MEYFLLKMNSLSYSASSLISGRPIVFCATGEDDVDFSLLRVGDFIAAYYDNPINKVNAIWQVEGDISRNSFTFNKICEASVGPDIDLIYRERLETETIIRLPEKDYVKIKDLLCKSSKDLLFVKTEIDDKISRQRIIFGAPGTGKSFKLNEMASEYFPTERNYTNIVKRAILDSKEDRSNLIHKAMRIGLHYSAEINAVFDDQTRTKEEKINSYQISAKDFTDRQWQELIDVAKIKGDKINKHSRVERVTFHPNYSYAQFVGTYKPQQNEKNPEQIVYKYVPGPFMRVYCNAKKDPNSNFLLLIEEINRANVAAVFGDVFQLLDRKNGESEYPIATSEDIKKYLESEKINDCEELKIPDNMYIWATMNSADQGVFPMDTAFKRRWEFEYIDIDHDQEKIQEFLIPINDNTDVVNFVRWNALRKRINAKLTDLGINEDKLMGPFFLNMQEMEDLKKKLKNLDSLTVHEEDYNEDAEDNGMFKNTLKIYSVPASSISEEQKNALDSFRTAFCGKVLMYLFEDAAKMKKDKLFSNKIGKLRFSNICKKFKDIGIDIFNLTEQ